MKIAIDITPLIDESSVAHRIRGIGFYIKNLKKSLLEFFPNNKYTSFTKGQSIPQDTDIVHYPYFEPFFLTLPIRKKYRTIVTVHDLTPLVFKEHFPAGILGTMKWWIQRRALKKVDAIITDSQSSKDDITKHTGVSEARIAVVYLAAGEEFKKVQSSEVRIRNLRKKYKLPEKFALYVGDVTWNKNLPRLLASIKTTNIPLVMVGKALVERDFDRENLWTQDLTTTQKLAQENEKILRLGFIPGEDLVILYNIATVFVMPSLYEGFGLPILEAMSCGCPVVTTRAGSLTEVAGNAAFYVDAYNNESIARGISEVFENVKLQQDLSRKGLMQAKKFSWEKTAKETVAIYKSL